jgi:plasmid stabilization system protein ParE
MKPIRWSPGARTDLVRLVSFLRKKAAAAASRAARRIADAAFALSEQPELGRPVEGEQYRELVIPFGAGAYVLRYRIDPDAVVIARVWHSRELRGGK